MIQFDLFLDLGKGLFIHGQLLLIYYLNRSQALNLLLDVGESLLVSAYAVGKLHGADLLDLDVRRMPIRQLDLRVYVSQLDRSLVAILVSCLVVPLLPHKRVNDLSNVVLLFLLLKDQTLELLSLLLRELVLRLVSLHCSFLVLLEQQACDSIILVLHLLVHSHYVIRVSHCVA